jgi:hypothetical protein
MYGLLLHVLFAGRRLPCTLALLTSVGLYFTLAQALGSPASPLMALLSLSPRQDIRAASLPVPRGVVPFYLAAACVLAAGVVMVLAMVKAHARKVTHNEK